MSLKDTLKQIGILIFFTLLFVEPHLLTHGTNIVTHTYAFGSRQFWSGLSPYTDPQGAGDWFKYSPLFAWFYTLFASFNSSWQAGLWGLFNVACFWTGVSLWFPWRQIVSKWLWLGFLFCSMEADGSFRYQQMNAALVGLTLLGMYFYKVAQFKKSGALLAIVSNVKILPALFLGALFFPFQKKYWLGVIWGTAFCLAIPAFYWGFTKTIAFHFDWYHLLQGDTQKDGILDLATTLKHFGFNHSKIFFLYPLGILSGVIILLSRFKQEHFDWDLWISFCLYTLLLINPRSESPTFVLGAPGYLFVCRGILKTQGRFRTFCLSLWLCGIFLITICMNDIWPKIIWSPAPWLNFNKTLGAFILWLCCLILFGNKLYSKSATR